METNIEILTHAEFGQVRYIREGDSFLFCGVDVAKALGYSNPSASIRRHCKGDPLTKREGVSTTTNQHGVTSEQVVEMIYLTEGNVYRLIAHSKLPAAEKFEHWVFDEVLPSIRKHGGYIRDDLLQAAMRDPTVLLELAEALVAEKRRNDALTAENAVLGEKAVFFDAFVDIQSTTNIRNTAKELGVPEVLCPLSAGRGLYVPLSGRKSHAVQQAQMQGPVCGKGFYPQPLLRFLYAHYPRGKAGAPRCHL